MKYLLAIQDNNEFTFTTNLSLQINFCNSQAINSEIGIFLAKLTQFDEHNLDIGSLVDNSKQVRGKRYAPPLAPPMHRTGRKRSSPGGYSSNRSAGAQVQAQMFFIFPGFEDLKFISKLQNDGKLRRR